LARANEFIIMASPDLCGHAKGSGVAATPDPLRFQCTLARLDQTIVSQAAPADGHFDLCEFMSGMECLTYRTDRPNLSDARGGLPKRHSALLDKPAVAPCTAG